MRDRELDDPDRIIQRRLAQQHAAATGGGPLNTTQPVGGPAPLNVPLPPGSAGLGGFMKNADGSTPTNADRTNFPNGPASPNAGKPGGPELPTFVNTATTPTPSPLAEAAKKAQAAGYTDIEGAGSINPGGYIGQLEGFNTNAWGSGERGTTTMKNTAGRIASRYDVKQPGALQAYANDPDLRAIWPDATVVGKDKIDFDGPGPGLPVDMIRGAVDDGSGQAWQWGVEDGGGAPDAAAGGGGGGFNGNFGIDLKTLLSGEDPMTDIIKRIEDLQGGKTPEAEREQLMRLLRGDPTAFTGKN